MLLLLPIFDRHTKVQYFLLRLSLTFLLQFLHLFLEIINDTCIRFGILCQSGCGHWLPKSTTFGINTALYIPLSGNACHAGLTISDQISKAKFHKIFITHHCRAFVVACNIRQDVTCHRSTPFCLFDRIGNYITVTIYIVPDIACSRFLPLFQRNVIFIFTRNTITGFTADQIALIHLLQRGAGCSPYCLPKFLRIILLFKLFDKPANNIFIHTLCLRR